jgi:hypothetical protein
MLVFAMTSRGAQEDSPKPRASSASEDLYDSTAMVERDVGSSAEWLEEYRVRLELRGTRSDAAPIVHSFVVRPREPILVGRVGGNHIVIPTGNVSKAQLAISVIDGEAHVTDRKSSGGTFVNGRRITKPTPFGVADRIVFGSYAIGLREAVTRVEPPTTPVAALTTDGARALGPALVVSVGGAVIALASRTIVSGVGSLRLATPGGGTASLGAVRPSRASGVVAIDVVSALPAGLVPLDTSRVGSIAHASRGDAFVVGIADDLTRVVVSVSIEALQTAAGGGGGDDETHWRAHLQARPPVALCDGAPLFAHLPAVPAHDLPAATIAYGLACTAVVDRLYTPEGHTVPFAELVPLDRLLGL